MIEEVNKKTNKRVLIIVDGLDRTEIQVQSDLFLRYGEALYSPKCHIVYIVAPSLLYERDTSAIKYAVSAHYRLPNFQIIKRDGSPDEIGRGLLKDAIRRRVGNELFSNAAIDDIVTQSGGIVRELLTLAREALLKAEIADESQVSQTHAREVLRSHRFRYTAGLRHDDLASLAVLYKTGNVPRTETIKSMIANHFVLENEDDLGAWYSIHPVLTEVVEQHLSECKDTSRNQQ